VERKRKRGRKRPLKSLPPVEDKMLAHDEDKSPLARFVQRSRAGNEVKEWQ